MMKLKSGKIKAEQHAGKEHQLIESGFSPKAFFIITFFSCLLSQDLFGQAPSITSFTPTNGPVGTAITITGANFNTTPANNIVIFGATRASVTAASATQLTVTVPTGATYAPITVLNATAGLLAYSGSNFIPTFSPNKGTITSADFNANVEFNTGSSPFSVAVGDLDGDGKSDLALTNYGSNTVSVLRNTGSSGTLSFDAKVDFTTESLPYKVAIGDLDGDGKADLAVANYASNTVSVFRNTGTGSIGFAAKVDFTVSLPYYVAIGDLDGDGMADLVTSNDNNSVSVLRNTGSIGTISFATKVDFAIDSAPFAVAIGDLDGDGRYDIAVPNNTSAKVSVFRNTSSTGTISFAAKVDLTTGNNPTSVAIGDLDLDGKADLVVPNYSSNSVSAFLNTSTSGTISFASKVDFTTGALPFFIAIGDLNGDSNADIAITNGSGQVSVFRNTGSTGTIGFATGVDFLTGSNPREVAIGDFDGDGKADLATSNISSNTVSILSNNPVFSPTITSFTPTSGSIGTTVTITGTNFDAIPANNMVAFNGTTAVVTASTATSITTTVPAGATTGKISVTVGGNTATSITDFTVIGNFITQWNLATAGSGTTQLSFGTATSGIVNYTWQEISPGSATGSGSWNGSTLTITGLPSGATIRLQIEPTNFQRIIINFGSDRNRLTQVENWGSTAWTSMQNAFLGCRNLQVTAADVPNLFGVTNMSQMFWLCTNLNSPGNINAWNTATVTDMSGMFSDASTFNQNIGSWNTSAVTKMQNMFFQASVFNQNIGAWNTAAVNTMAFMFTSASSFNGNIGTWNTAAVTDMAGMFVQASSFNQNIGSWNTAAVTNMSSMFSSAIAFNQNIGAWNTAAVIDMSNMFAETDAFNQTIGAWNTGSVTNMSSMFYQASAFNQNIGAWNVGAVTDMRDMFYLAIAFNQNIGGWNVGVVTDMQGMFTETNAFNQNIGSWNTGAVTSMQNMFDRASAFNQNIGAWTLIPGVDMRSMFDDSGMDCNNYSATMIGWSANPATPDNLMLGANGRQYGTNAAAARTNLTATKGWTIAGDTPTGAVCSGSPVITITTQPFDFITCVGGIATFTAAATGTTNITYQWQFSVDGVTPFIDVNNGGGYTGTNTTTLTVNTAGNFGVGRYRCKISGDLAATVFTFDEGLFINPAPAAPSITGASRCDNGSVTLIAAGGSNGDYRWYTTATGGTALTGEVNNTYLTPALTTTTPYFVAINNGSCESQRIPVVATINIPPAIPIITSNINPVGNTLTICSTTLLTLTAPVGFASYTWSNGASTQQISVSATGTYSVTVTDAAACVSLPSVGFVITVLQAPCNNQPPVISTTTSSTIIGGQATINLLDLISDADNNLVLSSLTIVQQLTSGASAIITSGFLEIDYKGVNFSGRDQLTIQVCDAFGACTQQVLEIDVIGDIEIYNGISPNGDEQNEIFLIRYIDLLPETQNNNVTIFNRWGSKVFEVADYNNSTKVFRGLNDSGNELPSGTYFYKIEFTSGRKSETGYLSLKR
jgi:gliding motility-associated-like protein